MVEVRKLVDDGEYADASAAAVNMLGNPSEVYQLLGDLKLEFDDLHLTYAEETYSRELDLNTATMNYWPCLPCNLAECQEPLFDFLSPLSINGSKTAEVNYEARGWVVHHQTDIWAKSSPIPGPDGYLETNPSTSPEHNFIAPNGRVASVSYSTTMDMMIINEVFSAVVTAAEVLGYTGSDLVDEVRKAQTRLRPITIAMDGSIMEWVCGGLNAFLFFLKFNLRPSGEDGPGWSTTWKVALWARLHDSENAYQMVKHLITLVDPDHEVSFHGGLYSNLFAAHPPFQIDANFGFIAAVAEMLVQSTVKDLYLLPALPRDKWGDGRVKGLKARGGVTVDIRWSDGDLREVDVWSEGRNSLQKLHYRGTSVKVDIASRSIYTFNGRLRLLKTSSL
ncbi:hypothetical protein NL676_015758 [Syzygium grande]|nr:hypothetical protein NL676_015758 [Syzygium grande]